MLRKFVFAILTLVLLLSVAWLMKPEWEVGNTLTIRASASRVWRLLEDLEKYSSWNAYYSEARGDFKLGGIVEVHAKLGESTQVVSNVITVLVPEQELCWQSLNWYRFLVYGTRCRQLQIVDGTTVTIRHSERFQGPLAWLIEVFLKSEIENGLKTHDLSLKKAAESTEVSEVN